MAPTVRKCSSIVAFGLIALLFLTSFELKSCHKRTALAFVPPKQTIQKLQSHAPLFMSTTEITNEEESTASSSQQNIFGTTSDAITNTLFWFLHINDSTGIKDASKNLRVLWARALLHSSERLYDPVASKLLPEVTRGLVSSEWGSELFGGLVPFLEWIQARTEFIDDAVDAFLESPVCKDEEGNAVKCQVVLFGAGYDTRALRYRHSHDHLVQFLEVDLPSVVEGKKRLYSKFRDEHDPTWDMESHGSNFVPFDLNDCGGKNPKSLIDTLEDVGGLKKDVPTLFIFEAVLFYVEKDAIENLLGEVFDFIEKWESEERNGAESMVCFTDSLKPDLDVPFTSEADSFFRSKGLDLLRHRARWGGAVHFALASNKGTDSTSTNTNTTQAEERSTITSAKRDKATGKLGKFIAEQSDEIIYSYLPTRLNNPDLLNKPSFDEAWYAVAYSWQLDGYKTAVDAALGKKNKKGTKSDPDSSSSSADGTTKPFATRFWGEPVVIYRDENGTPTCVADTCPHRSAPLSMGSVKNGKLTCFYHGWQFGEKGTCTDIPTLRAISPDKRNAKRDQQLLDKVSKSMCAKHKAVVEHEGMIWLWRGESPLTADISKLPSRRKGDMETLTIDSVLDYSVDYSYIVENNLDSPHLFYLHDGSVPPIESIGMMNKNLDLLRLSSFRDDCGVGHLGRLGDTGKIKKLIRFDPPNVVRHGGVSGFEEEFHIIPIAPQRTRVLLRQHLPRGPILSTITSIPGAVPFLTALVNNWNYHIGLEDASVMQGQAHLIEDFAAPRMRIGGLGDDLVKRYWTWRGKAHAKLNDDIRAKKDSNKEHTQQDDSVVVSPYFQTYAEDGLPVGIASGTSIFGDTPEAASAARKAAKALGVSLVNDDASVNGDAGANAGNAGTWGIKRSYVQETPVAEFPPMNYKEYKNALFWDDLTKKLLLGQEPSCTMIKTQQIEKPGMLQTNKDELDEEYNKKTMIIEKPKNNLVRATAIAASVGFVATNIDGMHAFATTILSASWFVQ